MSAAELATQVTAARAVRGDFERAALTAGPGEDWLSWALRLAEHLGQVLDVIGQPPPVVLPANADFRTGVSALGSGEFEVEPASVPPWDGGVGGEPVGELRGVQVDLRARPGTVAVVHAAGLTCEYYRTSSPARRGR